MNSVNFIDTVQAHNKRALNLCYCTKVYQQYPVNTVDSFLLQFIKQFVHRIIRNISGVEIRRTCRTIGHFL